MIGSVKLGNKRNKSFVLAPNEQKIDIDRQNPILGNPYVLRNHWDDKERSEVINKYKVKYDADWSNNGNMRKQTENLAARVKNGENLVLMCWCSGPPTNKDCHGDLIVERIKELIK